MSGGVNPTLGGAAPGVTSNPYGRDWACTSDLDPGGVEVDGITCLAQALFRRLITPRGGLIYDPNYGFDLQGFLNDDFETTESGAMRALLSRIGAGVDAELIKDERVVRSSTLVTSAPGGVLNLTTTIWPSKGPNFRLVVAATAVTVQLLQVTK